MESTPSIQHTTFETYLTMIKEQSLNEPKLLEVILQILENIHVNTFSDFMVLPEIVAIKTGANKKYFNTLNLFAYGSYRQYLENKEMLLQLTPTMEKKLKHLTILSLAIQKKTLLYDDLMAELDIKNVRDLEDLIIEAIYAELINGKLDQKNRQLEIDYAVARDIQTENVSEIVVILNEWLKSCESCSNCLQEQIERANLQKANRLKHKEKLELELTAVKKSIKTQQSQPNYDDHNDPDFLINEKSSKSGKSFGKNKSGFMKR